MLAAVKVPVFLSIMCAAPWLLSLLPRGGYLGVMMAAKRAFTDSLMEALRIDDSSRFVVVEAEASEAFARLLVPGAELDHEAIAREVSEVAVAAQARQPAISAWLLQCSDLPPYAAEFQRAVKRPVFDMTLFIQLLEQSLSRTAFSASGYSRP